MKNVKILSLIFALVLMFSLRAVSVFATAESVAGEAAETTAAAEAEGGAAAEAEEADEDGLKIQPMNFIYNLKYMGVGMFCIIVVIGVLIGVTMGLNKFTAPKK